MCGLAGAVAPSPQQTELLSRATTMGQAQRHRGPDDAGSFSATSGRCAFFHNRLSIIDLSPTGHQPITDPNGRFTLVFNGEIYNYRELRAQLPQWRFRGDSDSEVLLAAWVHWGEPCLHRLRGMFALAVWDECEQQLTLVRDRFGVKPMHYAASSGPGGERGGLVFASEIRTLHAAGVGTRPDEHTWATYLALGLYDHEPETFWQGIKRLLPGELLRWRQGQITTHRWFDANERFAGHDDDRPEAVVLAELRDLLLDSVALRFRSDVPVGVCLSGGLDSSTLLALVHHLSEEQLERDRGQIRAFTFTTGDPSYDEMPWVRQLLDRVPLPHTEVRLEANEVPHRAAAMHVAQSEPYGGIPTLAYGKLFEVAKKRGYKVLLDGQGLDEQFAGYDYYRRPETVASTALQGASGSATRALCLHPDFAALATSDPALRETRAAAGNDLRALQLSDITRRKLPRALRMTDRASMMSSCEVREPFLDDRLVALALSQPAHRKIVGDQGKVMLRRLVSSLLPEQTVEAPKRPVQTPQREWLRGELSTWAEQQIERALAGPLSAGWFSADLVREQWRHFQVGHGDHSFFVWQWIEAGFLS